MKYLSRLLIPLMLVLIVVESSAQGSDLIPFRDPENDKCGYKKSDGEVILNPIWDAAGDFSDGLARVYYYDTVIRLFRYYFINEKGEDVFGKRFSDAGYFFKGRAIVSNRYKDSYYVIDTNGDSLAVAFDELQKNIPGTRFQIVRKDSLLSIVYQGVIIFIRESVPWYDIIAPLKSGYIIIKWHNNGKYGLLNDAGYAVIQPQCDTIIEGNKGFFIAVKDGKYAIANAKTKTIYNYGYDEIRNTPFPVFLAKIQDKWGLLDTMDKEISDFIYDEIKYFEGKYFHSRIGNKYGLIDDEGRVLFQPVFEKPLRGNNSDLFVFFRDNKYGVISAQNKLILPASHKAIKLFDFIDFPPSRNFIAVLNDTNYYVVVDTTGKIISGKAFKDISDFDSDGLASVSDEWYYMEGVINSEFKLVIPCNYININKINEPKAFIVEDTNNLCGMFDIQGNELTPCEYQQIRPFKDGMAAVQKERKWGFINTEGKLVIPCEYQWVSDFSNGYAHIGLQTLIDKNGKISYTQ